MERYKLELQGRLTHPMVYDPASDHHKPIAWDCALKLMAGHLNVLSGSNEGEFYTCSCTSNEGR
jgi:anaerobic selenocysteine-containing dehydrogenase